MPNGLKNWKFQEIRAFLLQNRFIEMGSKGGSHHYFLGFVDGTPRLVHIQFHAKEAIPPKTLKYNVINKSGIPQKLWLEWGKANRRSVKKKIIYENADEISQELIEEFNSAHIF